MPNIDRRGMYAAGHKLTGGHPSNPLDYLRHIRFIIYHDLKPLLAVLTEDGLDMIDEMRRDISVRETEVWRLLHEDDQAAVVRFIENTREYRWGWVLQRQEDEEYVNRIKWADRVSRFDSLEYCQRRNQND